MRKATLAILAFAFCQIVTGQIIPLNWATFNLKNKVHTATFTQFSADSVDGKVTKISRIADMDAGFSYSPNFIGVLEFNPVGQVVQMSFRDTNNQVGTTIVFEYDENGVLVSEKYFENGREISSTIYTCDEADHLSAEQCYVYGKPDASASYSYDEDGRMVLKERFYGDGSPSSTVTWTYDKEGRVTEFKQVQPDGDYLQCDLFIYDKMGRLVKKIYPRPGETTGRHTTYEYLQGDLVVRECLIEEDGNCNSCELTSSDKFGNLIEKGDYTCDGVLLEMNKFVFDYSPDGNWDEKRIYKGTSCAFIVEASYTYY